LGLLLIFAASNFIISFVVILLPPLVLSFASPKALGTVLSVASVGLLTGGIFISIWGGPKRRINSILGLMFLQGMVLFLGGFKANLPLITVASFIFLFTAPIVNAASQAIWQTKVPYDVQGRVFAMRRMIAWSTIPFAYILSGPLADKVFEPMLAVNGSQANLIGRIIGTGPGRGIGLLFIILGALTLLIPIIGYLSLSLRRVEDDIPDVVPDCGC